MKKRTKVKLTSLYNLGNFQYQVRRFYLSRQEVGQPMLFFEQRARPPEVACPCSKNTGHTRFESLMNAETFSPVRLLSFLYDRRLPRLGGRCQAMVSFLMGMLYPFSLVRQCRGGWYGGLATFFVHIFWMVFEEGLEGWYGRCRNIRRRWAVSFLDLARK